MKKSSLSLRDALEQGVISVKSYDKENRRVYLYSHGSFFGSYSVNYYNRVFNSLIMPVPLLVLPGLYRLKKR